jgi:hypothetical protein
MCTSLTLRFISNELEVFVSNFSWLFAARVAAGAEPMVDAVRALVSPNFPFAQDSRERLAVRSSLKFTTRVELGR